jgi:hypothetical protein
MCFMTSNELDQVIAWARKGAKILIGRDHTGRHKIKVQHGFLGLRTTRLQCEARDVEVIRQRLYDQGLA